MNLSATLDDLYQRHLTSTTRAQWDYHDLLPWERGRNFQTEAWALGQGSLTPALTIAVETALLTEINLPWFTAGLKEMFASGPLALKAFIKTWTAEEDQHSRILDVYLSLSRNGDPVRRAQLRKHVLTEGYEIEGQSGFAVMVYTTLQELATRVFYQNLANAVNDLDRALSRILRAMAKDETLHFAFYRDAVKAYLDDDPGRLETVCEIIPRFRMPGATMPDFAARMRLIAENGGYGAEEYLTEVLDPLLRAWDVWDRDVPARVGDSRRALEIYRTRLDRIVRRRQGKEA
ncbi:fatty acid desaturase type 2 [Sulfobacillus acidophilus DSM 10332]|uniref:Fatty acid desaturase type 2 n=1 Tax=Sulfobacillus acidophilus (strain ATCC 700253 / DSM 10332 / NAL) TaxID=679936 RepID=G8TTV6_SULAD|nr:fatty acid desaturase type 2 [Sulfobacillus acidophilus DSM 10332]